MSTVTTVFGLIRHGRTEWNAEKRIQGLRNSPLTPRGRAMAECWGKQLQAFPWQRMLCSDLGRARETGQLVNRSLHLPMETDPRLREQDWGEWSGLTFPELFAHHEDAVREQEQRGWEFRPPGGESRSEVLARAGEALLDAHDRRPGEQILVVCHEGIIKTLLYSLLGRRFLPDEPGILRGYHLHLLEVRDGELRLRKKDALKLDEAA